MLPSTPNTGLKKNPLDAESIIPTKEDERDKAGNQEHVGFLAPRTQKAAVTFNEAAHCAPYSYGMGNALSRAKCVHRGQARASMVPIIDDHFPLRHEAWPR